MANKAYKFRIYPNAEQQVLFAKTFGCVRFIYDKMLSDKIDYYNQTGKKLNNTPAMYNFEFDWLKEVDSLALSNAQLNLQEAYNNFFKKSKSRFSKVQIQTQKSKQLHHKLCERQYYHRKRLSEITKSRFSKAETTPSNPRKLQCSAVPPREQLGISVRRFASRS